MNHFSLPFLQSIFSFDMLMCRGCVVGGTEFVIFIWPDTQRIPGRDAGVCLAYNVREINPSPANTQHTNMSSYILGKYLSDIEKYFYTRLLTLSCDTCVSGFSVRVRDNVLCIL